MKVMSQKQRAHHKGTSHVLWTTPLRKERPNSCPFPFHVYPCLEELSPYWCALNCSSTTMARACRSHFASLFLRSASTTKEDDVDISHSCPTLLLPSVLASYRARRAPGLPFSLLSRSRNDNAWFSRNSTWQSRHANILFRTGFVWSPNMSCCVFLSDLCHLGRWQIILIINRRGLRLLCTFWGQSFEAEHLFYPFPFHIPEGKNIFLTEKAGKVKGKSSYFIGHVRPKARTCSTFPISKKKFVFSCRMFLSW